MPSLRSSSAPRPRPPLRAPARERFVRALTPPAAAARRPRSCSSQCTPSCWSHSSRPSSILAEAASHGSGRFRAIHSQEFVPILHSIPTPYSLHSTPYTLRADAAYPCRRLVCRHLPIHKQAGCAGKPVCAAHLTRRWPSTSRAPCMATTGTVWANQRRRVGEWRWVTLRTAARWW